MKINQNDRSTRMNKDYANASTGHVSLGFPVRSVFFAIPSALAILIAVGVSGWDFPEIPVIISVVAGIAIWYVLVTGIRVAAQWERGVVLLFGKYRKVSGPGLFYIIPFFETAIFVDQRLLTLNIPSQQVITRDNVPASVEGVLFFTVSSPKEAVVSVQNFRFAVAQYAQSALRDVVGNLTLDELLSERERIQKQIAEIVDSHIRSWGLKLDSIRLQDIEMPEDLKRIMSRQASAEREKRATITKAEGDKIAADNLAAAAEIMAKTEGAMLLRTLQTIDSLGASNSNTVILFPTELTAAVKSIVDKTSASK